MFIRRRQTGLTLIELIVFIVIVSVALVGVLSVFNLTTSRSADPMVRKQALAIAEAILEEVMLQPFTWCDPDDPAAATATGFASCATPENTIAAEAGEGRGSSTTPWDNVNDYNGLSTTTNIAGGGGALYSASVTVAGTTLGPAGSLAGDGTVSSAALLVTVSVTAGGETVQMQGYRTRHSPTALP